MFNYRIKNYYLAFVFLLSANFLNAQKRTSLPDKQVINSNTMKAGAFINVNVPPYPASNFTATQLVTDVLIAGGSSCVANPAVSNVVVSPATAPTFANRAWGYFNKGTATFPFDAGIVLSTGFARNAGNVLSTTTFGDDSNSNTLNNNSGDADLAAALGVANSSLKDVSFLEFDFVPTSTQLTFNYIFASEEYTGGFPCSFTDGFALLLKPVGGVYTNLAVLPGGLGAVSVTNIRPSTSYDGGALGCTPQNPTYFAGYNNPITGHNFNGAVIPLTAQASVIPGQAYHIKMVIADYSDNSYDSAVFLEAGSFNIGVQILDPAGVALPAQIQQCNNEPKILSASVQSTIGTYQWFLNGTAIPGATTGTYTATQPGIFSVEYTIPGNTCPGTAQVEIIGGTSPAVVSATLTQCYGQGNVIFNLPLINASVTSVPGVTFTYYVNQADAIAGNANSIATPTAFSSPGGQTIYASVKGGFCASVVAINLAKASQITAIIENPQPITCSNPQITLVGNASVYPAGSTFLWQASNGGTIISGGNTINAVAGTAGTYTLTIVKTYQPGDTACTATKTVNVIVDKTPPLTTVSAPKTTICNGESITLTATGGANYIWNSSTMIGNTITVSPVVTTTYTVSAVGVNGCQSTAPATITINVVPAITSTLPTITGYICAGDEITLDAGAGLNYTYLWSNGATTQTTTVNTAGPYTVTISNGVCSKIFTTQVIQAIVPEVVDVLFENNTLTITASNPSNGLLEYSLDNGFTWQDSNVFINVAKNVDVIIKVRVKRTTCEGTLTFFTFSMINVITPNGDGINDKIDLLGISKYPKFGASIFDRYGKQLFKMDRTNYIWNGTFQGRNLNTDTYWYQLQYEHPASKKLIQNNGWILIKNRD